MKKFFKDFKQFISKGNVLDMAIGVIIGSAFSAIITALTDKIIMPFINFLLSNGNADDGLSSAFTFLQKTYNADGTVNLAESIYIDWGAFITAIINFFIIALVLFIVLRVAMRSNKLLEDAKKRYDAEYKMTRKDYKELRKRGVNLFNVDAIKKYKKEKTEEMKAEAEKQIAEENAKKEQQRLENPTQEDLLKEIRDLLKSQTKDIAKK